MAYTAGLSLRREYELFLEQEVEEYKERVSRSALLKIADEAAQRLHAAEQVTLNELVLCDEVDRIIVSRLRLPPYSTWTRRRRKLLKERRRPETWGLTADAPVVRNAPTTEHAHVLVAHPHDERAALYLAANGCAVTAIEPDGDIVARVMSEAVKHGLTPLVRPETGGLAGFSPEEPLSAVICTPAAFASLSPAERLRVLRALQTVTLDGGVHLLESIAGGQDAFAIDELRSLYRGWKVSVEGTADGETFVAKKS